MIFVLQALLIGVIAWTVTLYFTRSLIAVYHDWLNNFDFGIVEEAAYRFSRGDALFLTTRGDHAFADNQKYFQFLFGILNWFHLPQPMSLLLLHTCLGLTTGLVVALIFKKQSGWTMSLLMAAIVLLNPMLLNMTFDLVHSEILTPIFLLLAYYFWSEKKKIPFVIFMLCSIFVKEDVAFTMFALAFCYGLSDYIFEREKLKEWKNIYLFLMAASVLLFVIDMFVILPFFKTWTCQFLGSGDPSKMIGHQPANPWYSYLFETQHPFLEALKALWKKRNLIYLLEVGALLWLWNWRSLFFLALIPTMVLNMLSWADYQTSIEFHYEHTLIAVIMIGIAEAARKMSLKQNLWRGLPVLILLIVVPPFFPQKVSLSLWGTNRPPFREVAPTPVYKTLRWLQRHLPKDSNITGHYSFITYLMPPANLVFEQPNPYTRRYFGIYGVCEDWKRQELPDWWIFKSEELIPTEMQPFVKSKQPLVLGPITVYADPDKLSILEQALKTDPVN